MTAATTPLDDQQQDMTTGPGSRPGGGEDHGTDRARSVRRQRRREVPRGQLNVRLSAEDRAVLDAAARAAGMTTGGYIAAAALAAARQQEGPRSARGRVALAELAQARTQLRRYGVNVNQAVARLQSTGDVPIPQLVAAVEHADDAVRRLVAAAREVGRHVR